MASHPSVATRVTSEWTTFFSFSQSHNIKRDFNQDVPPWGRRGFKPRIRLPRCTPVPPYPQRVVKGD